MLCQTQFSFFRLNVPFSTPGHILLDNEDADITCKLISMLIVYHCFVNLALPTTTSQSMVLSVPTLPCTLPQFRDISCLNSVTNQQDHLLSGYITLCQHRTDTNVELIRYHLVSTISTVSSTYELPVRKYCTVCTNH